MEQTQTNTPRFIDASAPPMPKLACTGVVSEVMDPKVSESGDYFVQPIQIEGLGASRSHRIYWLYRPEWLRPGFKPDEYDGVDGGKSMKFVYGKNIASRSGISALAGLCGSQEKFEELSGILLTLPEITLEGVQAALTEFFLNDNSDTEVGYILRQQKTKTGEKDENGKNVYILEARYELDSFFYPTDEKKEALRKSAAKNLAGTFLIAFDEETPF